MKAQLHWQGASELIVVGAVPGQLFPVWAGRQLACRAVQSKRHVTLLYCAQAFTLSVWSEVCHVMQQNVM